MIKTLLTKSAVLAFGILKDLPHPSPDKKTYKTIIQNPTLYQEIKNAVSLPGVTCFYKKSFGSLYFYLVKDQAVVGVFQFDLLVGRSLGRSHPALGKTRLQFAEPHGRIAKGISGNGLLYQIYNLALDKGITLVSEQHTKAASTTWDKLASTPGIHHYWSDPTGFVDSPSEDSIRVLTKTKL